MSNVYAGKPDDRQSADVNEKVSRFRAPYRALTDDETKLYYEIKAAAMQLEQMILQCRQAPGSGHYAALALTDLESSVMWAVKALTA